MSFKNSYRALCLLLCLSSGGAAARAQGRLRPPDSLRCDANSTTSFTGRVLSYSRTRRRISLRMRTDENTTEQFTISLGKGEDASSKFLFEGAAFKAEDFGKIEARRGRTRPGMRATVWACYVNNEPRAELIDWQPREGRSNSVY